jgi:Primase C terminal 2 (PriCT-2)
MNVPQTPPGGKPAGPDRIDVDALMASITPIPRLDPDPDPGATWRAWRDRAAALADWTVAELLARVDCWTTYRYEWDAHNRQPMIDAATGERRIGQLTRRGDLDHARLAAHYATCPEAVEARIGLHLCDGMGRCRTLAIDLDVHDEAKDDPDAVGRVAAFAIAELIRLGLPHLVEESNGRGGLHLRVLLGRDLDAADAHRLGTYLVRGWPDAGLAREPEIFPGARGPAAGGCGKALRLPGSAPRHQEHYSAILDDDGRTWLRGRAAIDRLLSIRADPSVDPMAGVPAGWIPPDRPRRPSAGSAPPGSGCAFEAVVEGEGREVALARAAVAFLGYDTFDDYHDWIGLAMMLRSLGDAGFAVWDELSSECTAIDPETGRPRYDGTDRLRERWEGLRPGGEDGTKGLGTLFNMADAAGWGHKVPAILGARRRPGLLRRLEADGEAGITPWISVAWDRELDRPAEVLDARDDLYRELATRLGLSEAGLDVVSASIRFGWKQTNRETKAGQKVDLGPCWIWRERDGAGRTCGLRRLFAADVADPERAAGPRKGLIARRGILSNLAADGLRDGPIYLVRGLLDFAAFAARRLPCVALPAGCRDVLMGVADLGALLEGDARPLAAPYRAGDDPWTEAGPLAAALGRKPTVGVVVLPYPNRYRSIHECLAATTPEGAAP